MKKSLIVFLAIVVVLILFYIWRGVVSPTPAEAPEKPAELITFQGPPPGPAGGFKGPTEPPPTAP